MKYSIKFFKESLPAEHNNKSSILVKWFYRPLSFVFSSLFANMKMSANAVSYFSCIVAIVSAAMFVIPNQIAHIIGAVLANFWLLLDCVDGNIARAIKKQPFGRFADAMGSYLLVGLICTTMGFAAYFEGGLIVESKTSWIILIGALASSSDSLMRLIYQKYKSIESLEINEGIIKPETDFLADASKIRSFQVRVEYELGVGGILPLAILLGTIFHALDLVVLYCFLYYGGSFIISTLIHVRKATKKAKEYEATKHD